MFLVPYVPLQRPSGTTLVVSFVPKVEQNLQASGGTDLTCAFFLWGYLKERIYANKPATINALKNNIEEEIRAIRPETLSDVLDNALQRAQECENENGGQLNNIIFHY